MSAYDPKQTLAVRADESREPWRRHCIQWPYNSAAAVAVAGRFVMLFVRFASGFAALLLASGTVLAQGAKLTDPQIAHIAYTADQIDIEAAQQALQKSSNKDVIAFAQDMERDHKAVNDQALALVKKLNVTPEDNDTSKTLTKQATAKREELAKLNGAAFDKAYIDNEVAYHKTVDSALQNTLIPSASNPQLKDLLTTGLKIFQGHEQHAEHVAAEFK
jgi:putative membrane protein